MDHLTYIVFLFALGACIGSFLNVVVWRLPRGESLSSPPSHCPKCDKPLKWYDNIPIFGWIKLAGKCRYCRQPISIRYPIVELVTALLFVFYYVMYYLADVGPCPPIPNLSWSDVPGSLVYRAPDAPILLLHLFMLCCLLAASLIDLDLWLIPRRITYLMAVVGIVVHAIFDEPTGSGALNLVRPDGRPSPAAALAAGGAIGLAISLALWATGVLKQSFPQGEPMLDVEREAAEEENEKLKREGKDPEPIPPPYGFFQLLSEMRKEMAFLLPPMMLGVLWWWLTVKVPAVGRWWEPLARDHHVSGLLGALFGAMIGGGIIWLTRILGTIGFRRVAMGLGDVDLMFGIGAIVGAGAAAVTFFIAPFFGLVLALYMLMFGKRRELPYGPYLGLAAAAVLLCYCPIEQWLEPGLRGLGLFVREISGGGGD